MNPIFAVCGIASGVLLLLATGPYVLDTLKGRTQPERATWWIWLLLNTIAVGAQFDAGATWSLLMSVCQLLATAVIAILSLRHGYGRFQNKDFLAIVAAIGGLGLWWWLQSPLAALIVVVIVDFVGYWLTLEKAWKAPETETLSMWLLSTLAGVLAIVSVGGILLDDLIYPIYIMLGNALLASVIIGRRRRLPA